jgi:hypothetical protein
MVGYSMDLIYCSGQYKVESNYIAAVVDLVIQVLSTTEGNLQSRIHGVPRQSESRVSLDIFQGRTRQRTLSPLGRAEICVLILGTPGEDSNRIQGQGVRGRLCLKRVSTVPG